MYAGQRKRLPNELKQELLKATLTRQLESSSSRDAAQYLDLLERGKNWNHQMEPRFGRALEQGTSYTDMSHPLDVRVASSADPDSTRQHGLLRSYAFLQAAR